MFKSQPKHSQNKKKKKKNYNLKKMGKTNYWPQNFILYAILDHAITFSSLYNVITHWMY